jgi:hypothetical protein
VRAVEQSCRRRRGWPRGPARVLLRPNRRPRQLDDCLVDLTDSKSRPCRCLRNLHERRRPARPRFDPTPNPPPRRMLTRPRPASIGRRFNSVDCGRQARDRSQPSDMNRTVRLRDGHHTSSSSFWTLVATSGALLSVDRPPGSPTAITPWRPRLLHPRSRDGRRRPCLAASRPFASLTTRTTTTRPFRGTWRDAVVYRPSEGSGRGRGIHARPNHLRPDTGPLAVFW